MRFLFILVILQFNINGHAQAVNWTNDTGNHLWSEDRNWDTGEVPKSNESVYISNDSVVVDVQSTQVKSLQLDQVILENYGAITISNSLDTGFYAFRSTINNHNSIEVDKAGNSLDDIAMEFRTNSTLFNYGQISVQLSEGVGLSFQSGDVYLYGKLNITDTDADGLILNTTFRNYDTICINDIGANGLVNNTNFTNSGMIMINNAMGNGIENHNTFSNANDGSIVVQKVQRGIYNYSTFNNLGLLDIKNTIFQGLLSDGTTINNPGYNSNFSNYGKIHIDSCGQGLRFGPGNFINTDTIILEYIFTGPAMSVNFFHNTGVILGHHLKSTGLYVSTYFPVSSPEVLPDFTNDGYISLNDVEGTGVFISGYSFGIGTSQFSNNESAIINVHSNGGAPMQINNGIEVDLKGIIDLNVN